tara:strand:+ start:249 stop:515 length:267 start_codon:yes stop_codon:yes gene_type:complete
MKITSWQYPEKESLRKLIEEKKLYPITILKSVNDSVKLKLYKSDIILSRSLVDYSFKELKRKTNLSEKVLRKIIDEAKVVSGVKKKIV